jgi:O-methyltransferase
MSEDYQAKMADENRRAGFRDLAEPDFIEMYESVRRFSMTSVECLFDLYKSVRFIAEAGVPGALVECGVWRGGSMMLIAKTLQNCRIEDRELYLFDTFAGLPHPDDASDIDIYGASGAGAWHDGWARCDRATVTANLCGTLYPISRLHFIEGRVEETMPAQPIPRLALVRLDMDWYSPTKIALHYLWPWLSNGGLLIIDDYGHWQGARKATDEYFADKPVKMTRIDYSCRVIQKCEPAGAAAA